MVALQIQSNSPKCQKSRCVGIIYVEDANIIEILPIEKQ
jgi:hypothetical protein